MEVSLLKTFKHSKDTKLLLGTFLPQYLLKLFLLFQNRFFNQIHLSYQQKQPCCQISSVYHLACILPISAQLTKDR